jgi:hypothetical protein
LLIALSAAAATYFHWQPGIDGQSPQLRVRWNWPSPERLHIYSLAAVPIFAWIGLIVALAVFGMDEYHSFQFRWRRDYMLLFAMTLLISESVKNWLRARVGQPRRSLRWEIVGTVTLVSIIFAYHNLRIHNFVAHTAAHEYFLTKDEEELRSWLQQQEPSLGKYTLATASHELNYLCAYWTNADLMLPEGFPFHSGDSDAEIRDRMATLLAVYGATPESWLAFNLNRHVWDQWSWARSRLLSARHGYLYYLMHRELLVDGIVGREMHPVAPKRTTEYVADLAAQHDIYLRTGKYYVHSAGVRTEDEVADLLRERPAVAPKDRPDLIIIDEVSRGLGTPDLSGYSRQFQHGSLEAWVLADRRLSQR